MIEFFSSLFNVLFMDYLELTEWTARVLTDTGDA